MDPVVPVEWPDYDSNAERWQNDVRFPSDAVGITEWINLTHSDSYTEALRWLTRLRDLTRPPFLCPRIFISHRYVDRLMALKMAHIVSQCGFHFWLDILDPNLRFLGTLPPSARTAILMAGVIEMALLNCTHVIVLYTPQSKGSGWIPYEFGRVKTKTLLSDQAGSWIEPVVPPLDIEEYFHLGVINHNKADIQSWLNAEFAKSPGCPKRRAVIWPDHPEITDDLP